MKVCHLKIKAALEKIPSEVMYTSLELLDAGRRKWHKIRNRDIKQGGEKFYL